MRRRTSPDDLGIEAVHRTYEICMVDRKWAVWEERGFSWWAHRHRQTIWSEPGFVDEGFELFRISARTDFLSDVPFSVAVAEKLAALGRFATVATPVCDVPHRKIQLYTSVFVHQETFDWIIEKLFAPSAIIQVIEAETMAEVLGNRLGAVADQSVHPSSGARVEPDDMLNLVRDIVAPRGARRSPWADTDEFARIAEMLNHTNCYANAGRDGLTAEFPFGSDTCLLQAVGDTEHPRLGSGLLLLLKLPMTLARADAARTTTALNRLEAESRTRAHLLGTWTWDSLGSGYVPTFVSFIPTVLYRENVATNLVLTHRVRARWLAELLGVGEGDVRDTILKHLLAILPPEGRA